MDNNQYYDTHYKMLAKFALWPKKHEDDPTLDFMEFLETEYPEVWERIVLESSDDYEHFPEKRVRKVDNEGKEVSFEIIHRRPHHASELAEVFEKGYLWMALSAVSINWSRWTGQYDRPCSQCGEEGGVSNEIFPVASWNFAPAIKVYESMDMSGYDQIEHLLCHKCAVRTLKRVLDTCAPEKRTCIAYGSKPKEEPDNETSEDL